MIKNEKAYLEKIQKFMEGKAVDQRLGRIYQPEIEFKDKTPCGCFGAWIAVFHNKRDDDRFHYSVGHHQFTKQVSCDTIKKLEKIANVSDLFSSEQWDLDPDDVIKKFLEQNSKEAKNDRR